MKTQYTKKHFSLNQHRQHENRFFMDFNHLQFNHRFSVEVIDGFIVMKPNTCGTSGEKCNFIQSFSKLINCINKAKGNFNDHIYFDSVIKFNSLENANKWLSFVYDFLIENDFVWFCNFENDKQLIDCFILENKSHEKTKYILNDDFTFIKAN